MPEQFWAPHDLGNKDIIWAPLIIERIIMWGNRRKEQGISVNKIAPKERHTLVNEIQIRVRYEETDRMGYVYHGKYFTWFEVGRTELFRSMGLPYTLFEERGIMLPVTRAESRYRVPAGYDDLITIQTTVTRLTPARINFEYSLYAQDGRVIAEGNTGHAFVDSSGRPVNLAKRDPELWQRITCQITT